MYLLTNPPNNAVWDKKSWRKASGKSKGRKYRQYGKCLVCNNIIWSTPVSSKRINRHCSRSCYASQRKGKESANWNGGRYISSGGYVQVYDGNNGRYNEEHRDIMEKHIGRKLNKEEVVHHKNGKKDDNNIENLQVMTRCDHSRMHMTGRVVSDISRERQRNTIIRKKLTKDSNNEL